MGLARVPGRLLWPWLSFDLGIGQDFKNIYVINEPYAGGDLSTCMQKAALLSASERPHP